MSDVASLDVGSLESATIYLPLPSFGVTNSDLLDASWAAEKLATGSHDAKAVNDYSIEHRTRLKLDLKRPSFDARTLEDCVLLFQGGDEDDSRYQGIRDAALDYGDIEVLENGHGGLIVRFPLVTQGGNLLVCSENPCH